MQNGLCVDYAKNVWDVLSLIENADRLGYDVFSVIDHHFFQEFSISANPLALFSAAAQRTRNIRFRTLCHTLPLRNPVVYAGEMAFADILTRGRLDLGVGRGHAWEYPPAYMVGTSGAVFEVGARKAWALAFGGPAPVAAFKPGVDRYREACAKYGTRPTVSCVRAVYITEDERHARA